MGTSRTTSHREPPNGRSSRATVSALQACSKHHAFNHLTLCTYKLHLEGGRSPLVDSAEDRCHMGPSCVIIVAQICLPLSVQSITIDHSPVGSRAVAVSPDAKIEFDVSSDSANLTRKGLKKYCLDNRCIYYADQTGDHRNSYRYYIILFENEGEERPLSVVSPDRVRLERTLRSIRLQLPGDIEATEIPLTALEAPTDP